MILEVIFPPKWSELHLIFTYTQIAGTKEKIFQREPMLSEPQSSFNLKFICVNLKCKRTHLYT